MKKIIMYHYVRNKIKNYPFSNQLSKKKFLAQLKFFLKDGALVDKNDNFLVSKKKNLLTMTVLRIIYMAEELKKIGVIGIFFIPMHIYNKIF